MITKILFLFVLPAGMVHSFNEHNIDKYKSSIESILNYSDIDLTDYEQNILSDFYTADNEDLTDNESKPETFSGEDAILDVKQLIRKYGYPLEVHQAITEDGYILELHRIPFGKDGNYSHGRPIAFVQHGLLSSSADWIVMGPGKGLGYILADAGYDVWLGNFRGNRYSRKHIHTNPNKSPFWQFSWHEMGVYDLPAMIDKVLEITEQKQLFYMGHSQGTTTFFVMCSEKPEYNNKIKAMFAMAPIAYMSKMTSPLVRIITKFLKQLVWIVDKIGIDEFLPNNNIVSIAGKTLCRSKAITSTICSNLLFIVAGFNSKQLNSTMLPIIAGHTPAGASTKQFLHYGQLVRSGYFRQYDFGLLQNLRKYRRRTPPEYELERITAPVVLHYSRNDWLSHPSDVDKLALRLPNLIGKFVNPDLQFNHLDYIWAINANENLYSKIIAQMNRMIERTSEDKSFTL